MKPEIKKRGWVIGYLQRRQNQGGDFLIATHFGDGRWSKHVSVMNCWENERDFWRLAAATNMSSRACDIFLDFDCEPGEHEVPWDRIEKVILKLKSFKLEFQVYDSGGKGWHIHIYEPDLAIIDSYEMRQKIREYIMKKCGCDLHLISEKHLIPIPDIPHWRTGKPKSLVYSNKPKTYSYGNLPQDFIDKLKSEKTDWKKYLPKK